MQLPVRDVRVGVQDLRAALLELSRCESTALLEILELADSQILSQPRPHCLDGIEVATVGWEVNGGQPSFLVFLWCLEELLIVMPHLEFLGATTLVFEAHQ